MRTIGLTVAALAALLGCACSSSAAPDTSHFANFASAFDQAVESAWTRSGAPGMAVAVVSDDRVVYQRCFGVRRAGSPERVDPDTLFQIASISKAMSTSMVAGLVGEGVIGWDDRVQDRMPEFELFDPNVNAVLTLRDLLSHRSGLKAYAGDELVGFFEVDRDELRYRLRFLPADPTATFRQTYAYQNALVAVGVDMVGRAASSTYQYEALMSERLFGPLGMRSSSASFAAYERAANRASSHQLIGGVMVPTSAESDDVNAPAGAVNSTVSDMSRWVRMLLDGGRFGGRTVVDAAALAETMKPHTKMASGWYGMGWMINDFAGHRIVQHGGDHSWGISTMVHLLPDERTGVIILTNAMWEGSALRTTITKTFDDLYFTGQTHDWWPEGKAIVDATRAEMVSSPIPPDAHPDPARALSSYAGQYVNRYYGTVFVEAVNGALTLKLGHARRRALQHYSGDVFLVTVPGITGDVATAIGFSAALDGVVTTLDLGPHERGDLALGFLGETDATFTRIP